MAGYRVCLIGAALASASLDCSPTSARGADASDPVPHALILRAGTVDTSSPGIQLAALCGKTGTGSHAVIQLDGPMTPDRRTRLLTAGVRIGDYLPTDAFVVSLERATPGSVNGLDFIRWSAPYSDAWKLDPGIGKAVFVTPERQALAADGKSLLDVTLFDGLPAEPAIAAIRAIPGATVHRFEYISGNAEIAVTINTADLAKLAAMSDVQFVEEAPEPTLRNNTDRWIVQSNQPNITPVYDHGIHGEGQVVGILDERVDSNHCSFVDANPIGPTHRKILAYNTTLGAGTHGTHVAGTAVGDHGLFDETRGVAYAGKLVYNIIPSFTEASVISSLQTHHNQGGRVHTNSWGDDSTTAYNGLCRGIDSFLYSNEDSFVCFAVSNGAAVTNPENAKNLLAVGATQNDPNQASQCYGGTGPTADGRRKPEIFAPGCNILSSSAGTSCSTASLSGTSMATPAIAGSAMLVRQFFTDGFYPSGAANPGASITPSGALLKAVLLNSAVDMTGVAGYPSNQEGWGRVLLDDALAFSGDQRNMLIADVRNAQGLFTGGSATTPVTVLSSSQRLKVTLVWTEPPAAAGAAAATINNLDLLVTDPAGASYFGNVFAGGVSVPGGAHDTVNNVEQVHLNAPPPGQWTVQVQGAAVNQGTQGYALVVTGDIQPAPQGLTIALAAPPPTLLPPGSTPTIDAIINPGQDSLVPGSPTLWFRFAASGAFASTPMHNVSGNLFRATLPACLCGDSPRFYISAQGVSGGPRTAPLNAPGTAYAFQVGITQTTTVIDERFAAGVPSGWSATGLWHASSACQVAPLCDAAPYMAYGQDASCTFSTGATNSGSLITTPLALPTVSAGGAVTLTYCYTLQTENLAGYDTHRVLANGALVDTPPESPAAWQTRTIDLTSLAGQNATLRWDFDTVDATNNSFRGWQVDAVRITATSTVCPPSCRVDADGDGRVSPADVAAFVNAWAASLAAGTLGGDFDRDGAVAPADVSAFVSQWFAALTAGACP